LAKVAAEAALARGAEVIRDATPDWFAAIIETAHKLAA